MRLSVLSNREAEHLHVVSNPDPIRWGTRPYDHSADLMLLSSRIKVKSVEEADEIVLEKTGQKPKWNLIDAHFRWSGKPDQWNYTDPLSGAVYRLTADS